MEQRLIEQTYALVDEIKRTREYQELLRLHQAIKADQEVGELSRAFKHAEHRLEEANRHGKHHPDLGRYRRALSEAKAALYRHPLVREYKRCERQLEKQLEDISKAIDEAVGGAGVSRGGKQICRTERR